MWKTLSPGLALAILLAPLTSAQADWGAALQIAKQVAEWAGYAHTAYSIGKEVLGKDEKAELDAKLKEIQTKVDDIPELKRQVIDIRALLRDRPDRKEVLNLLGELRSETEVQIRRIEVRLGKVEKDVVNLQDRMTKLEMKDDLPAKIRLRTGTLLTDVILQQLDNDRVVFLDKKGEKRYYHSGEVVAVTVLAGTYQWVESKKAFVYHPDDKAEKKELRGPKKPEYDSKDLLVKDLKVILESMDAEELTELQHFADLRGFDWDKIQETDRLNMVKAKLRLDNYQKVRQLMESRRLDEAVALREVIHGIAQAK